MDLENHLESSGNRSDPSESVTAHRTADGNPSSDAALNFDNRLKRFAISDKTPIGEGELRLATVRDPADRIASCWLEKLVDGPAVWQAKYGSENWFPSDFRTPEAIEAPFLTFLEALGKDGALLRSDTHWAPQSWMLHHWQADRYVMTEELTDLPLVIRERLDALPETATATMPHRHRTDGWLKQFLLTPNAQSLIVEIYSHDYDFLERHCERSSAARHVTRAGFDAMDALKLPAFDREVHLRRNRQLSRSLATILGSAVWRHRVQAYKQQKEAT